MYQLVTPVAELITPHKGVSVATPRDLAAYLAETTGFTTPATKARVDPAFIESVQAMLGENGLLANFSAKTGKAVIIHNNFAWSVTIAYLMMGHDPDPNFGTLVGYTPDSAFQVH
jgi:hypothetical protein